MNRRARDPLSAVRAICLALPEVSERLSHGSPTWFVRDKKTVATFADHHHGDERVALWFPAPEGAQEMLVETSPERFFVPPYVGHRGWVAVVLDEHTDWDQVADLIESAYRKVAPRRLIRDLDERT